MTQARRGGLVKYPNAGSRDHAQYCASSKNRSTTDSFKPINRTTVSAARIATVRGKPGTASGRPETWDTDVMGGGTCFSRLADTRVKGRLVVATTVYREMPQ